MHPDCAIIAPSVCMLSPKTPSTMVNPLPSVSFEDSAVLYAACRGEDRALQTAAYQTLWSYLLKIALYMMRDKRDAEDLAADCAQIALVRIHDRLEECNNPAAFRSWARRIVSNIVIDDLRRRGRLVVWVDEQEEAASPAEYLIDRGQSVAETVIQHDGLEELRQLLDHAPISERSRRTIIGRYLDDIPDEQLAQVESEIAQKQVRPSNVQVTRSKNISKLRKWEMLQAFLIEAN